jgi:hypothetical protein
MIIIAIILLAFAIVVSGMFHHTESAEITIAQCQDMYSNLTLMDLCYQKYAERVDP